jgi:hypothetical protein
MTLYVLRQGFREMGASPEKVVEFSQIVFSEALVNLFLISRHPLHGSSNRLLSLI